MARVARIGKLEMGIVHVDVVTRLALSLSTDPIATLARLGCTRPMVQKVLTETGAGLSVPIAYDMQNGEQTFTFLLKPEDKLAVEGWDAVYRTSGEFEGYWTESDSEQVTHENVFQIPTHLGRLFRALGRRLTADIYCLCRNGEIKIVAHSTKLEEIRSLDGFLLSIASKMPEWAFNTK